MTQFGLGIEIGGTKLQAGIGGEDGKLLAVVRAAVDPARGGAAIRETLPGLVDEALSKAGRTVEQLAGAGIGFGGPVDSAQGKVLVSHQVEGWADFPLRDWVAGQWKIPVVLQNDCKCAALAEATHGAGKGCRRIFYVTIGSGIGGGLVVDGKVDVGQGLGAGEIGHTWVPDPAAHGKPEKLEQVASGWSIGRRAAQRMGRDMLAQDVYAAAANRDPQALAVIRETCEALAIGISNVVTLLHPEKVILGGGVSQMGPLFWDTLRRKVRSYGFKPFADTVELVPAALGEEVVVIGATLLGADAGK